MPTLARSLWTKGNTEQEGAPNHPEPSGADSLPHDGVLAGLILGLPLHADHLHPTCVQRGWDPHLKGTGVCSGELPSPDSHHPGSWKMLFPPSALGSPQSSEQGETA